jgi:hypothetical protein
MKYRQFILGFLLFFSISFLYAQDTLSIPQSRFHKLTRRKPLIAAGLVLNTAGILYTGYNWWWKGNYHPFQMRYEGYFNNYSLGVDKVGHFYISHLYFHTIYDVMKWGGFSKQSVLLTSIGIPALYAVTIEIADGFTTYHFSWDDLGANLLGIGLGVWQKHSKLASCFQVKWSYYPSSFTPWKNSNLSLSDDYDGHIYWLSLDVYHLLPEKARIYWPKWLNLAGGYGVQGASVGSVGSMRRKFVAGIDFNLRNIPFKNPNLKLLAGMLDNFKFPAPGWRKAVGEKGKVKGLILN